MTPRELGQLKQIERIINRKIIRRPIPTVNEAIEGQQQLAVERLMKAVAEERLGMYKELAGELLEETDSVTLLSAALKLLTKETNATPVVLTDERPQPSKNTAGINKGSHPDGMTRVSIRAKPYGKRKENTRGFSPDTTTRG